MDDDDPEGRVVFEANYRAHASTVYTHFRQRGVQPCDAQDLTGEVFAIAWRRQATITPHPTAGLLPWLLVTANNLIRQRQRTFARGFRAMARLGRHEPEPDIAAAVTDRAENDARLLLLAAVLARLSVPEQEVLQLCVLRGLAPSAVSAETGEPPGTIRSRLSRALTKARAGYRELADDDEMLTFEPRER